MAIPIKETPVLKGKDAKRFRELTEKTKKISSSEMERIKNNYNLLSKIASF